MAEAMSWREYRDGWLRMNSCRFCQGSRMHTCTSYRCQPALERAAEYFESFVAQHEVASGRRKYVEDLTIRFREEPLLGHLITGAWVMRDLREGELVIRFHDSMPGMQQAACARIAAESLMRMAEDEMQQGGREPLFCGLVEELPARAWREGDAETVRAGIPVG